MQFPSSTAALLLTTLLASLTASQDLSAFPECSLQCFATHVPATGCALTDVLCQCTAPAKDQITRAVTPCVIEACGPVDAVKVQPATQAACERALASASASGSGSGSGGGAGASRTGSAAASASATAAPEQSNGVASWVVGGKGVVVVGGLVVGAMGLLL
ncbi:hypothetical protein LTS18_000814 [Coniosporium uncinatum]|uniref:Uncharacterized protein n=1 Tax=Coniosporium uncinatum TaxID=93489 RepID=A0ACC3DV16_9PEZI|nr:hypothetical protein LTS18_000814 [Coniosporium uncinatum]